VGGTPRGGKARRRRGVTRLPRDLDLNFVCPATKRIFGRSRLLAFASRALLTSPGSRVRGPRQSD